MSTTGDPAGTGYELSVWLQTVLGAAMDAVVVIDGRGRVRYWNPAAAAMFGHTGEYALGRDVAELIIPVELREQHRQALAVAHLGRPESILGRRIEVVGQRADGTRFPVELTITRTDLDGTLLYTGYLRDITDRRRLLDDLRSSRSRLVQVSDHTRRQIERDLHDGAQQQLVGLAMLAAQAQAHLHDDPATADALLSQFGEVLTATIAQIRELANGVLPPALTQHGLVPAVSELARRSPIPASVDVLDVRADSATDGTEDSAGNEQPAGFGRWDPTVETTIYFVAAEALTNAAKHGARHVNIHLAVLPRGSGRRHAHVDDQVVIECVVSDDGPGAVDIHRGTGLIGLHDRVAAVGGTLHIDSPTGIGTSLQVQIPASRVAVTDLSLG